MTTTHKHLFCFGMGYCANVLAAQLAREGWTVSGTSRKTDQIAPPTEFDTNIYSFDGDQPMAKGAEALAGVTHLLISIPPARHGDVVLKWHKDDIARLRSLEWVGYLSTTGVYGNTNGAVVDETSPTQPSSPRSQDRLDAETEWLRLRQHANVPVHVFRLPGIYGPTRSVLDQIKAGNRRRIHKPGHKFSRIHVDDIANTLTASMAKPHPGRIYNVCDNEAASPAEVMAYACDLLGVATPDATDYEVAAKDMSPMALSFWQDNRRVDNHRIKTELGVRLKHPTYREGLSAIHQRTSDN